jgi:hypothetical protein
MSTDANTPEAAFAAAQQAMVTGDWDAFFDLIASADLRRLAAMGLGVVLGPHAPAARAVLGAHGIGVADVDDLTGLGERIAASAAGITAAGSPAELAARSQAHRDLVQQQRVASRRIVAQAPDLPRLVAAVERFRRATEGGGSVSSRLFVGERLVEVVVEGKRARGTRGYPNGTSDPVRFAVERGGWKISIFAR